MNLKNHTVIDFTKSVEDFTQRLGTLRTALDANTQATGFNTVAVEGITKGLKELAKQTGDWRTDDKKHHEKEGKLDQEKIDKMEELTQTVKDLVEAIKK